MTTAWRKPVLRMVILMILVGMPAGCVSVWQSLTGKTQSQELKPDRALLDNALAVYQSSDYQRALGLFKVISATDAANCVRETAHLGEICCRLMLADTPSDYKSAIGMWKIFRLSASANETKDAMALFDPLIVRLSAADDTQQFQGLPQAAPAPLQPIQADDKQLQSELTALKKKAAQANQLQHQLDAVVAENESLKEKIKALETIDQNIQKKKTEISAPSE